MKICFVWMQILQDGLSSNGGQPQMVITSQPGVYVAFNAEL